jgi:16S rRNA (guanine527-N7)-methyltransferase
MGRVPTRPDKQDLMTLLRETSREVGVRLGDSQAEEFWLYLQELMEWNRTVNLTAVADPVDIIIKHFIDSLTPLPYLASSTSLLDVGSGAGFPGIPLKIAAPYLRVCLVDSQRRKVSFLKHIIRTLSLREVTVVHGRVEDLPPQDPPFTAVISRAFRRIEPLLEVVSPLLSPGCTLIAMLGPTTDRDHRRFRELASAHGLRLDSLVPVELPRGRGGRTLLFFEKT